jgi:hypothetical protein
MYEVHSDVSLNQIKNHFVILLYRRISNKQYIMNYLTCLVNSECYDPGLRLNLLQQLNSMVQISVLDFVVNDPYYYTE